MTVTRHRPKRRAKARTSTKSESTSTNFERQIERIHRLLESEGSKVTWNDKIPDPDNPKQPRQIDITIRRDGQTTHIECRIHRTKQGVKWIEELQGRKESLCAGSVIAVSASGFTKGAINKSIRFGIILRSLYNLSEKEIRNWGKESKVKAIFYEFVNTTFAIELPRGTRLSPFTVTNKDGSPVDWRGLLSGIMTKLDDNKELDNNALDTQTEIFSDIIVNGVSPVRMVLLSTVRRLYHEISLVSVVAYTAPGEDSAQYAYVAKYDLGAFEILQGGAEQEEDEVAVVVDLSQLATPPNCVFRTIWMDFGRGIWSKWFQLIGAHNVIASHPPINILLVHAELPRDGS